MTSVEQHKTVRKLKQVITRMDPDERLVSSPVYAEMVNFGSTLRFYLLGNNIIVKRQLIRLSTINEVVYALGILLILSTADLAISSSINLFL